MITLYNMEGEVSVSATSEQAQHVESTYMVMGWDCCFEKAKELAQEHKNSVIGLQSHTGLFMVFKPVE